MSKLSQNNLHLSFIVVATVLVVVGDGIAKASALAQLGAHKIPIFNNVVDIFLHKNLGVVSNIPIPLAIVLPLTVVILIGCLVWLHNVWRNNHRLAGSLILLIGGATGNFIDRIVNGFTTDYLLILNRSVINLADVLILLGVLGILFTTQKKLPK